MIVPQAIFSRDSIKPLLAIWSQLESEVSAAFPHPRNVDIRGEFSAIANAWQALANGNSDTLDQFHKNKARRQSHEDASAKRVQETYNDFLKGYNQQWRSNAVALGSLWTCASEDVVPYPGKASPTADPIEYALRLAHFHQQHWASALGFLHYIREIFNLHDANKLLGGVAKTIEERYFTPLHRQATQQWMTLLIIGGSAADLQLAREKLAAPYITGTYDTASFLNSTLNSDAQHPLSGKMKQALSRAITHPRSDPEPVAVSSPDLGLG